LKGIKKYFINNKQEGVSCCHAQFFYLLVVVGLSWQ